MASFFNLSSWWTSNLVTAVGSKFSRLRVDVGQTGFFEGRQFRFDHHGSGPIVIKFTSDVNFILQSQDLVSHDGTATLSVYAASLGAPSGTFNTTHKQLNNNRMSEAPDYTSQVSITSGGSFTPTLAGPNNAGEYIKVVTSTATAQRSSIGGSGKSERGLPAGDYYLVFTGTDWSYSLIFEERP